MLKQAGFTLTELMIVIFIVAMLAAASVPAYNSYVSKSKFAQVFKELAVYQNKLMDAQQLNDFFPSSVADLTAGSYTAVTSEVLKLVFYDTSTNSDAAYLYGMTLDLGLSGYVEPANDGTGCTRCRITFALVPTSTGYMRSYCGQWDGTSADVPLSALPSSCQDTNISALIS